MQGQSSESFPTEVLAAARAGDKDALDSVFAFAYQELRALARKVRRQADSLSTTALVHEAYLKIFPAGLPANDAAHLKLLIGRAMRQVLIDAARRRAASKRGGGDIIVTLDNDVAATPVNAERILALNDALAQLQQLDPRRAAVVECRFFGGLDVDETARALGLSTATVKRDWRTARAWLAEVID